MSHFEVLIRGAHKIGTEEVLGDAIGVTIKRLNAAGGTLVDMDYRGADRTLVLGVEFRVVAKGKGREGGFDKLTAESMSMDAVIDAGVETIYRISSWFEAA